MSESKKSIYQTSHHYAKHKWAYSLLVAVSIILPVIVSVFFCTQKQGYHLDEIYSYGLANSNYKPFLSSDGSPEFVSSDYYNDYISATDSTKFNYGSVVSNQEHDVHPPLYYILLHTISSIFTGDFSKWFGLVLNLVFFTATLIIIFITARLLTKNKFLPIACVLLYGLSTGAIFTVTYIRMYMMLTMFVALYTYQHVKMIVTNSQKAKNLIALSIITFLGFLTQYYFIIFAFFMSALYSLLLLSTKKWKAFWQYALSLATPLLLVLIIYPYAYTTILGINNKVDGFNHAQYALGGGNSFYSSLADFAYFLNSQLFSCLLKPITLLVIGLTALRLLTKLYKIKLSSSGLHIERIEKGNSHMLSSQVIIPIEAIAICLTLLSACLYVMVIAKISYYKNDHYIFCIYPLISAAFVFIIYKMFRWITDRNYVLPYVLTVILVIVILVLQYTKYYPSGRFPDTFYFDDEKVNTYMNDNPSTTCLFIYNNGDEWSETHLLPWLRQCEGGIHKMQYDDLAGYMESHNITQNSSYTLFMDNGSWTQAEASNNSDRIVRLLENNTGADLSKERIAEISPTNHWSIPTTILVYNISIK